MSKKYKKAYKVMGRASQMELSLQTGVKKVYGKNYLEFKKLGQLLRAQKVEEK